MVAIITFFLPTEEEAKKIRETKKKSVTKERIWFIKIHATSPMKIVRDRLDNQEV